MNIKKLLGRRIKELRLKNKMKQAELAEMLGVEPRSISRIESGFHFPKDENLEKFADIFNIEIKDLFDFSHLENTNLISKINERLLTADNETLKLIYRIINVILK